MAVHTIWHYRQSKTALAIIRYIDSQNLLECWKRQYSPNQKRRQICSDIIWLTCCFSYKLTRPQEGLTVSVTVVVAVATHVVLVFHAVTLQPLRASRACVGSGALGRRPVTSLRMLFTGTSVPVTIGDSGKLTIGQELVVKTVLRMSISAIMVRG